MPSGYTRPRDNSQPQGLMDWMNVTKPSFWGLLGQKAQGMGQGLLDAFMAPGNALAGQYDQYYDPSNGQTTYGRNGNPYAMMGDASNLSGMVTLGAGAVPRPAGALDMGIKAYHGTPHSFDAFDISKIGTGEGAQAYGHGLYFAESPGVARTYRDTLTIKHDAAAEKWRLSPGDVNHAKNVMQQYGDRPFDPAAFVEDGVRQSRQTLYETYKADGMSDAEAAAAADKYAQMGRGQYEKIAGYISDKERKSGNLYEVDINAEPHDFLDWDKPLSEQPKLKDALAKLPEFARPLSEDEAANVTGQRLHQRLANRLGEEGASQALRKAGIQGVKYLDAGSRGAGDGSRNYVVFHHDPVKITGKLST